MTRLDVGLRHRLRRSRRQIVKQHEQLRTLHRELADAMTKRDTDGIREAVDQFWAAVEAHFAMESGVFFPALHGLFPDAGPELEGFIREHDGFIERLRGLREAISADTLDPFMTGFAAFEDEIVDHEEREERLVEAVMKQVDPA